MNEPSKLMCQLAYISRGMDIEHPEYKRKSRSDLAIRLRKVIKSVSDLEKQELDQSFSLHAVNDCVITLLDAIEKSADLETIKEHALEIFKAMDEEQ
jgi:hypothetical protein